MGRRVSVVCSDVDRCEFRYEVRWTLEVKLGDSQPSRIERWLSWCGGDRCPEFSRLPGPEFSLLFPNEPEKGTPAAEILIFPPAPGPSDLT